MGSICQPEDVPKIILDLPHSPQHDVPSTLFTKCVAGKSEGYYIKFTGPLCLKFTQSNEEVKCEVLSLETDVASPKMCVI